MAQINARFVSVVDGDTAVLRYIKPGTNVEEEYHVRLLLLNAPELGENRPGANRTANKPYAKEAKDYLEKALKQAQQNGTLKIEYDPNLKGAKSTDTYGRELVYVHANGQNMSSQMVKNGLARMDYMFEPDYKYRNDIETAQQIALRYGNGIWSSNNVYDEDAILRDETRSRMEREQARGSISPENNRILRPQTARAVDKTYEFAKDKAAPQKEYFSGANVKVYFGDVWVDQLTEISFSLQEQVAPIYGFHSYTFDRISRGNRMVQGSFTINFTENGYMRAILKRVADNMMKYRAKEVHVSPSQELLLRTGNAADTIHDLTSISDEMTYDQQIEALKNSFWGDRIIETASIVPWKENDSFFYTQRGSMDNLLKENGFNVLIDFSPDANRKDFEDCMNNMEKDGSLFTTYRNIIGVHIGSETQQIANNGQVLSVTYQFIARDLDGDITRRSLSQKY